MTDFYADTSALIKRHVQESGSAWMKSIVEPIRNNTIVTARLSLVEIFSALNRRRREANLSWVDYQDLAADVEATYFAGYHIVDLTETITHRARQLLEQHPLRTGDAIQLASALLSNETLQAAGLPALTFIAADNRLIVAATAEGLTTGNPNDHP